MGCNVGEREAGMDGSGEAKVFVGAQDKGKVEEADKGECDRFVATLSRDDSSDATHDVTLGGWGLALVREALGLTATEDKVDDDCD